MTGLLPRGSAEPALCRELAAHINALPWSGSTGLDWGPSAARLPIDTPAAEVASWLLNGVLVGASHVLVLRTSDSGVIVTAEEFALRADELIFDAGPGPHFACVVAEADGTWVADVQRLVQYGVHEVVMAHSATSEASG